MIRFCTARPPPPDHFTVDRQEGDVLGCQLSLPLAEMGCLCCHPVSRIPNDRCTAEALAKRHQRG